MHVAGNLLTEGVDPSREEWKAWTSFRDSIAEEWNPDSLKAVAFILNRVRSLGSLHAPQGPFRPGILALHVIWIPFWALWRMSKCFSSDSDLARATLPLPLCTLWCSLYCKGLY